MPVPNRRFLLLLISLTLSESIVEFTHSSLYGTLDFKGVEEIPLPRCDNGCLIFASTGGYYQPSDDGFDPYIKNLIISDQDNDMNYTNIAELAIRYKGETAQKVPLELTATGNYSIINLNALDKTGTDFTVWIVHRNKAQEIDYEIYDAVQVNLLRQPAEPKSVITFMSAQQFRVIAQPGEDNSYTARLAGFDNAFDENPDLCTPAYSTPLNSKFDGMELHVDGPLLSLVFANKKKVEITADYKYSVVGRRDMTKGGFISTSGYTACQRLGGKQIHNSLFYHTSDNIELHGEPDFYDVYFDAFMVLDMDEFINVTDFTNEQVTSLNGAQVNLPVTFKHTQYLEVSYFRLVAPQCFLIRHTPIAKELATTLSPTTIHATPTTKPTVPTTRTSTAPSTTTSASGELKGLAAAAAVAMLLLTR